jgi:hypothetical protein
MKSAEEALRRLSEVSAADRDWIVRALSVSAKARLRGLAARHGIERAGTSPPASLPAAPVAATPPEGDVERTLEAARPASVVSCLEAEPAWILAALLAMRAWSWEESLLARLAPSRRLEVARLRASVPRLSPKLAAVLARTLAQRIAAAGATQEPGLERMLRRTKPRAWRRGWALGLGS